MREISVKVLRANISKELMDLPFAVTVRGVVVAEVDTSKASVHPKDGKTSSKCTPEVVKCTPEKKATPEVYTLKEKIKEIEKGKLPRKATMPGAVHGGHDPHRIGKQRMDGEVG